MQSWSPEPLVTDRAESRFVPERAGGLGSADAAAGSADVFLKDHERLAPRSVLDLLSVEEKNGLWSEVERQLREEFAAQRIKAQADQAQLIRETLSELGQKLQDELQQSIQLISRQTAGLAITVAEKIVRRQVQLDPEVIDRTLQTVLFKLQGSAAMTLTVHPEDAAHLRIHPELLESLQIGEIKEDRRIERGGCLIQADRQEWDATLAHQLNSLAEIVQEVLAAEISAPEEDGEDNAALE